MAEEEEEEDGGEDWEEEEQEEEEEEDGEERGKGGGERGSELRQSTTILSTCAPSWSTCSYSSNFKSVLESAVV